MSNSTSDAPAGQSAVDVIPRADAFRIVGSDGHGPEQEVIDAATCLRLSLGYRVPDHKHLDALASPLFGDLTRSFRRQIDPAIRADWPSQWLARLRHHDPRRHERAEAAWEAAKPIVEAEADDDEPDSPARRGFLGSVIGSSEFAAKTYPRDWLIRGVLVLDQPAIVGGAKKVLKTSTMVDLAIAIGTATPFLGEFDVPRARRVLMLSGESGESTTQETMRRVCRSKGLDPDELEGQCFWGFALPRLGDEGDLADLTEFVRENDIKVVIVDPLYLCLLQGGNKVDAANLFDVGPLLQRVSAACLSAGATPILVHHLRKNRDSGDAPPELEDLAFAGVQEFARQWLLIGRRDAYEPGTGEHRLWLSVGGSAGHSGCWAVDISEGVVGEDFGGRDWRVRVTRASEARAEAKLKQAEAAAERKVERTKAEDQAKAKRIIGDASEAEQTLDQHGPMSKSAWRNHLGWNAARFDPVLEKLIAESRVEPCRFEGAYGRGRRVQDGYRTPSPEPPDFSDESRTNLGQSEIVRETVGGVSGFSDSVGSPPVGGSPLPSEKRNPSDSRIPVLDSEPVSGTHKRPTKDAAGAGGGR